MNKNKLVAKLREIYENELDDVLQGDYDERNEIMCDFETLIERIEDYQNN